MWHGVGLCWAFGLLILLEGVRVAYCYCGLGVASEVRHYVALCEREIRKERALNK